MNQSNKDEVVELYLDDIIPNRFQPREVFDEKALKELAVSIKEHGVIQPIIVRSVNGKYEIIAGERRYKASALAGLTKIPAIVRNLDDKEASKVALLENLQRKDLNPIEEARTYQKIIELDQMTQDDLAKTMGKSQSAIANKIRLLSLPTEIQDALLKDEISERHARTLLSIDDNNAQKELLNRIIKEKITVRELEKIISDMYPNNKNVLNDVVDTPTEKVEVPNNTVDLSQNKFINNAPLAPTVADIPEDKTHYGEIKIAPPAGEELPNNTPKFINYGEIDEDDDNNDSSTPEEVKPTTPIVPVDINDLKENATDINAPVETNRSGSDLDSLLNITPVTNTSTQNKDFKFITPAEAIVKNDEKASSEHKGEYFKTPDLVAINLPNEVQIKNTNNVTYDEAKAQKEENDNYQNKITIPTVTPEKDTYDLQDAIEEIRNTVNKLKDKKVKVDIDEMNFKNSYQIIVKLTKSEEE